MLVNRSSRKKLIIRNDGVMPATCLFEMVGDDDFVIKAKGISLTVVFVSFAPKVVVGDGNRKATIKVSVLNIRLTSTGSSSRKCSGSLRPRATGHSTHHGTQDITFAVEAPTRWRTCTVCFQAHCIQCSRGGCR
mmetsp:Transcript_44294/g.77265  ORF Transcript_44294/g.77265 Transcript_44294/m.77265 type:complete len:134 (-) Transcript_44294:740-1141(-)